MRPAAYFAILLCHAAAFADAPRDWKPVAVPGTPDAPAGFVWFRCHVKVPDPWVNSATPDLYGESVSLQVENVADACEVYVNGVRVGAAGGFPPKFRSASGEANRFKVPWGTLKKGRYNVIAVRVYSANGPGGFRGRAPVLAGYHDEGVLKGEWEFRPGDDKAWAIGAVAERPARAVFERFGPGATPLIRPATLFRGKHLPPAESLKTMKPAADLDVDQLLTEPLVAQPVGMRFDERGRLWVVQYRQYPYPAGLTMVSRDKFYRAVYDKVPPPPPHQLRGDDRITVHEDTDGDGRFDKHTTFADGLSITTAVAFGHRGVWVLNPPYLLHYPAAGGDPVVHLEGFGLEDTHSVASGLRLGPDGWLYGVQGSTTSSTIKVRGSAAAPLYCEGSAVWRYHPATKRYEIFCEGGGNPVYAEFDARGRLYAGTNSGNARGFHYLQGGYYFKGDDGGGGGKYGALSNPYVFGILPYMAHAPTPRFSHALVRYEEATLPERYRGKLLCVDPLRRNVILSEMIPAGSTFRTVDHGLALESTDPSFRPVGIEAGPDGVYVADMCEEFIAHGQHFLGQIDPGTGRVYRLRAKGASPAKAEDLGRKTTAELLGLLAHPGKWQRQTAQRLLADRQDRSTLPALRQMLQSGRGQTALEALWAVNRLGAFDEALAAAALDHPYPPVRAWTVRLLGDPRDVSVMIAKRLAALATREPDAEVRAQLACTAKRLPATAGLAIVRELVRHDRDTADPCLPLLLWWAVESKVAANRDAVVALFREPGVWQRPLVAEVIVPRLVRRLAAAGTRADLLACATLFALAPGKAHHARLMAGFEQAYRGRPVTGLPPELVAALLKAGGGSPAFRVRQGDGAAIDSALTSVADEKTDPVKRVELIETLGEVREARAVPVLLALVEKSRTGSLVSAALTALQNFDQDAIGAAVLRQFDRLPADAKPVALSLLASRKAWARLLVEAVDAGQLKAAAVPLDVVRKLTVHRDDRLAALVSRHWKDLGGATTAQMQQQIARLAKVIEAGPGDPHLGRKLYLDTCAKCHTLYGEGGRIGPDLTAHKRDDTLAMLLSVVNPSAEIREGFESYVVTTSDGRVLTGFIHDQDTQVVTLRTADGQTVSVPRARIDELQRQPKSLMPEGLLDALSEQQVRDLFAYLRGSQPLR